MAYGGLRGAVGFSLIYILFDEDPSPTNRSRLIINKIIIYYDKLKIIVNKILVF